MQIEIDDDVALPESQPHIITRKRKNKDDSAIPAALKRCVQAYREAYAKVYGVLPVITCDAKYIHIRGNETGVTKKRLREMTIQLRWRAG